MHAPRWRNLRMVIYFFQKSWTKLCSWMKWASLEHKCFRYWNFVSLKRMFNDRNKFKFFSVLNLTITCINPFTSNKTTFSVPFLYICLHKYLCHQHCRKSTQWCQTATVINWFKNLGTNLSNSTLLNSIHLFQAIF